VKRDVSPSNEPQYCKPECRFSTRACCRRTLCAWRRSGRAPGCPRQVTRPLHHAYRPTQFHHVAKTYRGLREWPSTRSRAVATEMLVGVSSSSLNNAFAPSPVQLKTNLSGNRNQIWQQNTFALLSKTDGMRRPVSGRDAVGSQVIDVLKAQIKGDRQRRRLAKQQRRRAAIFLSNV